MRIIAGDYKGRRLYTPQDNRVRPTTDKVKEALFSIIAPYIGDAVVVDLFAGTGNLGLEALSRGAERCYFSDNSKESLKLIKENVGHCVADEKSIIYQGDYQKVLSKIQEKVDIVLLDPPYKKGLMENCLFLIQNLDILSEDGIIVAEHSHDEVLEDVYGKLYKIKERKYGKIVITLYSSCSCEE